VYLDESFAPGGGYNGPSCRSCKKPILEGERSVRIAFESDTGGVRGMTGEYHVACSKPFNSLARALNMLGRFGR
jgi:hypothetical protein